MRALLLLPLLLPPLVLADVGLRQGNTYIGPVRDIDCYRDGGLLCVRDAGFAIGKLSCVQANATEPGCITPSAQTFAGVKTWNDRQRFVGVAHASLTACSAGVHGLWQNCTTHNSPVYCNGTSNVELVGSSSLTTLGAPIYVNGLLHSRALVYQSMTLPFAFTVSSLSGYIEAGVGSGDALDVQFSDGTNLCTCSVDCDTDQTSVSCTGTCSYAASTLVTVTVTSDNCDAPPTVKGILQPAGYR